jgi:peroxiredoxin
MKKTVILFATLLVATLAQASLKPGDSLTPYEIKNVADGKQYCQVCAYGGKAAKVVAFGKLKDEGFWSDLQQLQKLHKDFDKLGVFAQVIDSKDAEAIKAAAREHGITFPVVVAVEKNWDKAYQVHGVSRTIYYAKRNNSIVWTSVGLNDSGVAELQGKVKHDAAS